MEMSEALRAFRFRVILPEYICKR